MPLIVATLLALLIATPANATEVTVTRIDLIVLTHAHVDHAGAVAELARRDGTPVVVQASGADGRRYSAAPPKMRTSKLPLMASPSSVPASSKMMDPSPT